MACETCQRSAAVPAKALYCWRGVIAGCLRACHPTPTLLRHGFAVGHADNTCNVMVSTRNPIK